MSATASHRASLFLFLFTTGTLELVKGEGDAVKLKCPIINVNSSVPVNYLWYYDLDDEALRCAESDVTVDTCTFQHRDYTKEVTCSAFVPRSSFATATFIVNKQTHEIESCKCRSSLSVVTGFNSSSCSCDGEQLGSSLVNFNCDSGYISQEPAVYIIVGSDTEMTLTCNIPGVSTAERYAWKLVSTNMRLNCTERTTTNKRCTFQPTVQVAWQEVQCAAIQSKKCATITPNILYPPSQEPRIQPPNGTTVRQGGKLTCDVTGGRPNTAINVSLSCLTTSNFGSYADTAATAATVPAPAVSAVTCSCKAIWQPMPSAYNRSTTVVYYYQTGDLTFESINENLVKTGGAASYDDGCGLFVYTFLAWCLLNAATWL